MSAEENKTVVREAINAGWGKFDTWEDDCPGAFSDMTWTVDKLIAGEDDWVTFLMTVTATQAREFRGVQPTGKPVTFQVLSIAQVKDGKLLDEQGFSEGMGTVMFHQTLNEV